MARTRAKAKRMDIKTLVEAEDRRKSEDTSITGKRSEMKPIHTGMGKND